MAPIAPIAAPHSSTAPPLMSTVDVSSALASIMESLHAFSTQTNITLTGVNNSIGSIQVRLMAVESRPASHLNLAVWPSLHSNEPATSDPAPHSDPATSADAAGPSSHSDPMEEANIPAISPGAIAQWHVANARYAILNQGTGVSANQHILSPIQQRENAIAMQHLAPVAHYNTQLEQESIDLADEEARLAAARAQERRVLGHLVHVGEGIKPRTIRLRISLPTSPHV